MTALDLDAIRAYAKAHRWDAPASTLAVYVDQLADALEVVATELDRDRHEWVSGMGGFCYAPGCKAMWEARGYLEDAGLDVSQGWMEAVTAACRIVKESRLRPVLDDTLKATLVALGWTPPADGPECEDPAGYMTGSGAMGNVDAPSTDPASSCVACGHTMCDACTSPAEDPDGPLCVTCDEGDPE